MDALLIAMMLWLSANFDLPSVQDLPHVKYAPSEAMASLRYDNSASVNPNNPDSAGTDTLAVYRDDTQTIYLREEWKGQTAADLSILLHELVHHMQNAGGLRFECAQQREQLAYRAQQRWLGLFGSDLQKEFGLDAFTLLVKSACY
jgi:Domain of unknown function (DUF6647)